MIAISLKAAPVSTVRRRRERICLNCSYSLSLVFEDNELEGFENGLLPNVSGQKLVWMRTGGAVLIPKLFQIPHDRVEGTIFQNGELLSLWMAYRPWFSAHNIVLYELRQVPNCPVPIGNWCAPPVTASSLFPFATRLGHGLAKGLGRSVDVRVSF